MPKKKKPPPKHKPSLPALQEEVLKKFLSLFGLRPTGDLAGWTLYTDKRGRVVWFPKSPPTTPPTLNQRLERMRWTAAAKAWKAMPKKRRDAWKQAAKKAHLYIAGYHLWVHWQTVRDRQIIETIERQSGLDLL